MKHRLQRFVNKVDDSEVVQLFSPRTVERGKASGGVMRSHDYEAEESPVWRSNETAALFRDRGKFWTSGKKRGLLRWLVTVAIGMITAFATVVITYFTGILISLKFEASNNLLRDKGAVAAFPAFLVFNLFFVYCANFVVRLEPMAAGSGMPEIKTWLNGVAIPRLVRAQTLVLKAIGVVFSVAGGLPCSGLAAMVQIGSGVAAGLAQGKSTTLGFDTSFSKFQDFRNDREKRDFVACGAAAGLAAAFGAPIAGVLFTLEESASFWSTRLTWRTFFCTLVTVYTLFLIRSARSWFGKLEQTFMFNFGEFYELESDMANYSVWELLIFIGIGGVGGLLGAGTVHLSKRLTLRRQSQTTTENAIEVHLVCVAASLVSFCLPLWFGKCTETPNPDDTESAYTTQEQDLIKALVQFECPDGHYNELASLWFTAPETAIKQLFHYRAPFNDLSKETFSAATLILFMVPYHAVFTVMIGCAAPGGVFIPAMMSGAGMGRLVGHTLMATGGSSTSAVVASTLLFADKGTYALMGAAAALSGLTRLTISATVMLLEATGNMQYVLPIMLSVMSARFVGDQFNDSIQDMQIQVNKLPFLEVEISRSSFGPDGAELTAGHVMSHRRPPVTLTPVLRVKDVVGLLESDVEMDFFPIVDPTRGNCLVGSVLRKTLCLLLKHKKVTFADGNRPPFPTTTTTVLQEGKGEQNAAATTAGVTAAAEAAVSAGGHSLTRHALVEDVIGALPSPLVVVSPSALSTKNKQQQQQQQQQQAAVTAGPLHLGQGGQGTQDGATATATAVGDIGGAKPQQQHNPSSFSSSSSSYSYHGGVPHEDNAIAGDSEQGVVNDGGDIAGGGGAAALSWAELQRPYPRWPQVQDAECRVNDAEGHCWLDLRPYMNAGPYMVHHSTSVGRTYRMFRTLGLRHLCVVDYANRCVGVVTRSDLSDEALSERSAEVYARRTSAMDTSNTPLYTANHVHTHGGGGSGGGGGGGGVGGSGEAFSSHHANASGMATSAQAVAGGVPSSSPHLDHSSRTATNLQPMNPGQSSPSTTLPAHTTTTTSGGGPPVVAPAPPPASYGGI